MKGGQIDNPQDKLPSKSPALLGLISEKGGITDSINHDSARIWIESYNYLPIEKMLTLHGAIIVIKPLVNKNKNNLYYNMFLEKGSYKHKSNTEYF